MGGEGVVCCVNVSSQCIIVIISAGNDDLGWERPTVYCFVDGKLTKICLLSMGAESPLLVTKKVCPHGSLSHLLHKCIIAVHATTGFRQFQHRNCLVSAGG